MSSRHMRNSIHNGFNFTDNLKKLWAKKGTASYPIVFYVKETGEEYELTGPMKTDERRLTTMVEIHAKET